ncbi:unnamed protein product [Urochloa decumbens]|uniref:Uncharacterized protein n=1 Tax=Urochloa decumbens TaxID=240449 RepID=A0ABC8VRH2_9POAL
MTQKPAAARAVGYGASSSTTGSRQDPSSGRHAMISKLGPARWIVHVSYPPLLCAIGGGVINHNGDVIGMSTDDDLKNAPIMSITTILTCIEMWTIFGRIARPRLGMCFRTVELLDMGLMDELRYIYGIRNGFIVDEVILDSYAEKLGVRRGDVIVSFSGISSCYLPQFEDFLLSVGLDSLRGMRTVNAFKLEVHNLLQKVKRTITLPVQLSDASEY